MLHFIHDPMEAHARDINARELREEGDATTQIVAELPEQELTLRMCRQIANGSGPDFMLRLRPSQGAQLAERSTGGTDPPTTTSIDIQLLGRALPRHSRESPAQHVGPKWLHAAEFLVEPRSL